MPNKTMMYFNFEFKFLMLFRCFSIIICHLQR